VLKKGKKNSSRLTGLLVFVWMIFIFCSVGVAEEVVTITAALQSQTSDYKSIVPLLQEFEKANPNIKVEVVGLSADTYVSTAISAWEAGSDRFDFVQGGPIATYVEAGYVIPLDGSYDPAIKLPEEMKADFFPSVLENGMYNDKLYFAYYSTDANPFYYREDLFAEAGFEQPPTTLEELVEYGQKLTVDENGDGRIDRWGFAWWLKPQANSCAMWFYNLLHSNGGQLIDEQGKLAFDSDAGMEALQFMYDLLHTYKISPEASLAWYQNEQYEAARNGMLAMWQAGNWVYSPLNFDEESPIKGKVGVAPFPKGKERSTVLLGGNGFMIAANSKHKQEAWKAIEFLLSYDSQVFMSKMGQDYSGRKSVYSNPEVRGMAPEFYDTYYKLIESAYPTPKFVGSQRVEEIIADHVSEALHGLATPEQALKNAKTRITRELDIE